MTRSAICLTLVLLMLVQFVPLSPAAPGIGKEEELPWEPMEKNERFPMELRVWTFEDDLDTNERIDELHIDVTLQDPLKGNHYIFTELSSLEYPGSDQSISQVYVLEEDKHELFLTYQGTDIYLRRLQFPLVLEFRFVSEKGEEGRASYLIKGDLTFLQFESPHPVGFEDEISYQGMSQDSAEKFDSLAVTLTLFTRQPGIVSVVGELRANMDEAFVSGIPREYIIKVDDPIPVIDDDADIGGASRGGAAVDPSNIRSDERSVTGDVRSDPMEVHYQPEVAKMKPGTIIDTDIQSQTVPPPGGDPQKIILTFSGSKIHSSHWDGPFILTTHLYFNHTLLESLDWIIKDNPYDKYQPAKVHGSFSTTDYLVKGTRDGTTLTVWVDILLSGRFNLTAEAYSVSFTQKAVNVQGTVADDGIAALGERDNVFASLETNLDQKASPQPLLLLFEKETFLDETFIYLTLTTVATGGQDSMQIRLKPTEPAPGGPVVIDSFVMKDQGIDKDNDKRFEFLSVRVTADIPDGDYNIEARLYSPEDGIEYGISSVKDKLKTSSTGTDTGAEFEILFPGEDIFISGINGPYTILIYLTSENGTISVIKGKTHEYKSLDFSPKGGRENTTTEPEFSLTNNSLFLHTDVFASEVLKSSPELVFYYYTDMGESVRFRVKFTRLIAFNDDGNGQYDAGEEAYEAFLSTRNWKMSPVSQGVDSRLGSHLSFNMSTGISLHSIGNSTNDTGYYIRNWGQLTLHFLISNNSVDETEFRIRGGEELKITIEIDQFRTLDINAVTLEQKIFLVQDGDLVSSSDESRDDGLTWDKSYETGESCENDSTSQLSFVNDVGEVMGYYSWACTAMQYFKNGSSSQVDVDSLAQQQNDSVVLFLTYPMSRNVSSMEHDPSVGVIRENAPSIKEISAIKDELEANPWSYLLGLLLAGSVVFVTIFKRKPKPGKSNRQGKGNGMGKDTLTRTSTWNTTGYDSVPPDGGSRGGEESEHAQWQPRQP